MAYKRESSAVHTEFSCFNGALKTNGGIHLQYLPYNKNNNLFFYFCFTVNSCIKLYFCPFYVFIGQFTDEIEAGEGEGNSNKELN